VRVWVLAHMADLENTFAPEDLVGFLYTLMRDHTVPGVVEKILQNHCHGDPIVHYSNKHLEGYARDVARRLMNPLPDASTTH